MLASWTDTHAKEIAVVDGPTGPLVLALREAAVGVAGTVKAPVQVVAVEPDVDGSGSPADTDAPGVPRVLATLPGERQARFLVQGDVDGDGTGEIVVTGRFTGVWMLEPPAAAGGAWSRTLIDGTGRGFEQAAHITDLDGDGQVELYVVHEPPRGDRVLRRYTWPGPTRTVLHHLTGEGMVWDVTDGRF